MGSSRCAGALAFIIMNTTDSEPALTTDSFERAQWQAECKFRDREITIKEREQDGKDEELALKKAEQATSHWKNPLVVAIFAAAVAGLSNAGVAFLNGSAQRALEAQKAEQARIFVMIKTGSQDTAAENLRFLLNAGLIRDPDLHRDLTKFLDTRKPGSGPVLPLEGAQAYIDAIRKEAEPLLKEANDRLDALSTDAQLSLAREKAIVAGVLNPGDDFPAGDAAAKRTFLKEVAKPGDDTVRLEALRRFVALLKF